MKRIILGLGSNKSFNGKSCLELLNDACHDLTTLLKNVIVSSVYRTKAMYVTEQDDFYNMALLGYVTEDYNPFFLLEQIHEIEEKYGRNREKEIRFGPRSLDIDIEIFGDEVINTPDLQIPHIRFEERAFVLIPMLELLEKCSDDLLKEKCEKCLMVLKEKGERSDIKKIVSSSNFIFSKGGKYGTNG